MLQCCRLIARKPVSALTTIFRQVLATLFGILTRNNHEKLSETCYEVLVSIINDVTKLRQNRKVLPVLDSWIENEFKFADVWRTLLFHFFEEYSVGKQSCSRIRTK
eukprot:UN31962